jgi:hypothetical protein
VDPDPNTDGRFDDLVQDHGRGPDLNEMIEQTGSTVDGEAIKLLHELQELIHV